MRTYYKTALYGLLCTLSLGMTACTANYEDINQNPYGVTDGQMDRDGYNIISALLTMQNNVIPTEVNTCQFTDCVLGGPWGGYFSDSNASWDAKISTYNASDNWMYPMFKDIIPAIYPAYRRLQHVTTAAVPLSIAMILKVAAMHRITDTYGPIPYSKIGGEGKLQVTYDTQKSIYQTMFDELDLAIKQLTEHQAETITAKADLIYGGDLKNWIRYANSLKLRLAMRVVYADEELARTKAVEAVSHPLGVITSNAGNAALTTFGEKGNPMDVSVKYNDGDSHANADITSYMNGYQDPRRAAYFVKSAFTEAPYMGLRSGITIPAASTFTKYSAIRISGASPLQWMNAAEVAFLRAEGALRGWQMGGTAQSFYEQGIRLSFEQWKVSGADAYIADAEHQPEIYKDPLGIYSHTGTTSTITIHWNDSDTFERNLERIIVQKWIANWTLGNEAWAERRRTGYPQLMPVVVNGSQGLLKNGDTPRRLPYPLDEYSSNTVNVRDGVAKLGGADNIATRVWWDCKK